jgi:hypothetical protein
MVVLRMLLVAVLLSSCSTQKKLKRSIERHGIKESIGFVVSNYPEYFRAESVTVHDTIEIHDTIIKEAFTIDTVIVTDTFRFENERLKIELNRVTGTFRATVKHDTIFVNKTVPIAVKCPELICPDVAKLEVKQRVNWWWYLIIFAIGIFIGRKFLN